jgi:uncharacterized integral membrane protein
VLATLGTILKWVILLPILAAVVLLAVANDQTVTVHLNPFDTADPVLRVDLPLYQVGFILFVLGTLVGGLVAWRGQRKHRRRARQQRQEAALWQARAEWSERQQSEAAPSAASALLPHPERG